VTGHCPLFQFGTHPPDVPTYRGTGQCARALSRLSLKLVSWQRGYCEHRARAGGQPGW
jgi:hypothetical protein